MSTDDDPDAKPKSRTWYRVCATLGILGGTITLCSGFVFLSAPTVLDNADQMSSRGTMKQLSVAAHGYTDTNGRMPGPFVDGELAGHRIPDDPYRRLSWRVALMPYFEHETYYKQLSLSEPWDSQRNTGITSQPILFLADPADARRGNTIHTPYRVFHDNGALWDSDPKRRIGLDKIPDGASNTILIAESTVQVPWAQFNEHRFDPDGPLPELGRASRNTLILAMADGSVRTVKKGVDPNILRAAVTREGGEQLPLDK